MRHPERWTVCGAWSDVMALQVPGIAEHEREFAHLMFLAHPDAPSPDNVIWPSVVTREVKDASINSTRYEIRGEAFR